MTLSTKTKESIKTALAMSISYGIALSMAWDRPYWAGFAVAFVSLASVGQSLNKAALAVVRAQMQRLEEMTRALFAAGLCCQDMFMKLFPKIIIGLAILLVLPCFSRDLFAAQQLSENQKSEVLQVQGGVEPDISKIIPLATDLSARLNSLESKMTDILDVVPITKEFSVIETRIEESSKRLQKLKGSKEGNYTRYLEV